MSETGSDVSAGLPAADIPPEQLASISAHLAALHDGVEALKACFEERLQYDAAKDKAFDVLYGKLREQDVNQSAALKKNLIMALLRLHDHMQDAEASMAADSPGRERIAALRTGLLDILYAEDVEPISTQSPQFDRARQQAIGSVPAEDPALDNTVERVLREGFVSGGRVLRPQTVIIRRYQPITTR
jgi:molecular chaperone GrpE (heat shock protein)